KTSMQSSKWLRKVPPLAVLGLVCFVLGILCARGTNRTAEAFTQVAESAEEPAAAVVPSANQKKAPRGNSIRDLSQHFNEPDGDISPWLFVPKNNIKLLSTSRHPGLATLYEAGAGKDIKGILKEPIKIGDYRLPWEFQTSFVQSFNALAGVGAKTQI